MYDLMDWSHDEGLGLAKQAKKVISLEKPVKSPKSLDQEIFRSQRNYENRQRTEKALQYKLMQAPLEKWEKSYNKKKFDDNSNNKSRK